MVKYISVHRYFVAVVLFMSVQLLSAADTTEVRNDKFIKFQSGYIVGGQVFNDNFLYNPGFSIQSSYLIKASKRVGYGIGVILMNIGMYAGVPATLFYGVKRRIDYK